MARSAPSHEFGDATGGLVERCCEEDSMKVMLGGRP
jgi:hypothetical protein